MGQNESPSPEDRTSDNSEKLLQRGKEAKINIEDFGEAKANQRLRDSVCSHIPDKGLISKMCKELIQLNSQKIKIFQLKTGQRT